MNQQQAMKKKAILGAGEYGCWECTLLPQIPEPGDKNPEPQPELLYIFARSLAEIAENFPAVESAVLKGKATCIADPMTPGVQDEGPDVMQEIAAAQLPVAPPAQPEFAKCPYCGKTYLLELFVKPENISAGNDLLLCPNENCRMLSPLSRLRKVKPDG